MCIIEVIRFIFGGKKLEEIMLSLTKSRFSGKKILFLLLLMLIYSLSFAQVQWQESGVPVRQGENIGWDHTSVSCDDETFVSIWTDTRNGIRGVYAQKIDTNGNLLWGENGIEIYNPDRMQSHPIAISSTNNSVIVCWQDYDAVEYYTSKIRVQKIDASGNFLWGEVGILLEESGANGGNPQMVKHSDGGVFIIWNETPQSDIKGIRLLADGSIAVGWGQGIELLPALYKFKANTDQMDGVILSSSLYDDIYIQRVDEDGNKLWGYNGTLLYNGSGNIYDYEIDICSSIAGEYYFSWGIYSQDEIMMHKTDSDGNPVWNTPIIISGEDYISRFLAICPSDSQPIVAWICGETLFSQKIDSDGNLLWGEEGIIVFESNYYLNRDSVILKEDIANGCILSWTDYDYNYHECKFFVQRLNSNGDFLFGDDGLILYVTSNYGISSSLAITDQRYYFCWLDNLNNFTSLAHQIIDEEGNIYLEENGEEMFVGLSGTSSNLQMLSNEDNPIMIWIDYRNGRIYLQILNSDGSTVFAEDGIPITTISQSDQNDLDAVYGENSGTITAVWSENKIENDQIFAQGIDTSGNYLWSDSTGIALTTSDNYSYNPQISSKDNSGTDEYYIGWEDFTDFMNPVIYGQKIIDGEKQWGEYGIQIAGGDYAFNEMINVIDRFFIWSELNWPILHMKVKLVDENGNTAQGWPENGLLITGNSYYYANCKVELIPSGLLITWEEYDGQEEQIYGQILDYDGNILWQEGGIPLIEGNYLEYFDVLYNDSIYLVWNQYTDDQQFNYYMQKFDEDGEVLWQDGGIQISYFNFGSSSEPVLTSVENDILVVWEHRYEDEYSQIKAQLVSPYGDLQYNLTGLTICDQFMDQKKPQVYVNGTNAYISWRDERSTAIGDEGLMSIPGVYAQKVYLEPTSAENEIVPETTKLFPNYPNPFNPTTTIKFNTENTEDTELTIYNIKGQKIRTFSNLQIDKSPNQQIIWNGTDENNKLVSSGIYFYKLKVGNFEKTRKMILMK